MYERIIGRDLVLGATSLLMLGGTLLQVRPINAENSRTNIPNKDNSHSLYIDNPGLVDQAIKNARLNIPSLQDLAPCRDPQSYRIRAAFTDGNTRRLWGVRTGFGIPPNDPARIMSTIDNCDLNRGVITNYIQQNENLDPEAALGHDVTLLIEGLVVDTQNDWAYILKGVAADGNIFRQRAERFRLSNAINNPINQPLDFSTNSTFNEGLPQGGTAGNRNTLTMRIDSQGSKSLEAIIIDSVIRSEDGTYNASLDRQGNPFNWRAVLSPTVQPSFTVTAAPRTATVTFEPIRTFTPEPLRTPTPTTITGNGVRGASLTENPVEFSWQNMPNTAVTALFRLRGSRFEHLATLPATTSSFRDNTNFGQGEFVCYTRLSVGFAGENLGLSPFLCSVIGTRTGAAPRGVRLSVDGMVTFSYDPNPTVRHAVYEALPAPRFIQEDQGANSITYQNRGPVSVAVLLAFSGSDVSGHSNVFATFSSSGTSGSPAARN